MICKRCGTNIDTTKHETDGSVVCPNCGMQYRPKAAEKPMQHSYVNEQLQTITPVEDDNNESPTESKRTGTGLKAFAFTLTVLLVIGVGAALILYQRVSKDATSWSVDNGVLTISGTGPMDNYAVPGDTPWGSDLHEIESVIIQDGITSIGDHAFAEHYSLTSISVPSSVTSIGDRAFYGCKKPAKHLYPCKCHLYR